MREVNQEQISDCKTTVKINIQRPIYREGDTYIQYRRQMPVYTRPGIRAWGVTCKPLDGLTTGHFCRLWVSLPGSVKIGIAARRLSLDGKTPVPGRKLVFLDF